MEARYLGQFSEGETNIVNDISVKIKYACKSNITKMVLFSFILVVRWPNFTKRIPSSFLYCISLVRSLSGLSVKEFIFSKRRK